VLQRLDQLAQERHLPAELVASIRAQQLARLKRAQSLDAREELRDFIALKEEIEGLLIDAERRHIFDQLERGELIDEARRHIERELDLWEAQLLRNIPGAVNHEA
jgi:monovalent cation/hydrogen antiporter